MIRLSTYAYIRNETKDLEYPECLFSIFEEYVEVDKLGAVESTEFKMARCDHNASDAYYGSTFTRNDLAKSIRKLQEINEYEAEQTYKNMAKSVQKDYDQEDVDRAYYFGYPNGEDSKLGTC